MESEDKEEKLNAVLQKAGISKGAFFLMRYLAEVRQGVSAEDQQKSLTHVRSQIQGLEDQDIPAIYAYAMDNNNPGLASMVALETERRKGEIKDWGMTFTNEEVKLFRSII